LGAPLQRTLEKAEKQKMQKATVRPGCGPGCYGPCSPVVLLLELELLLPAALRWWILMERFGLIQNSFVLLSLTNLG